MSSAGLTCHPKKKAKIVSHDVVLYNANGSQVDIEHHTSLLVCVDTGYLLVLFVTLKMTRVSIWSPVSAGQQGMLWKTI